MSNILYCYFVGYNNFAAANHRQVVNLFVNDGLSVDFNKFDKNTITKGMKICQINNKICTIGFITNRLRLLEKLTN
jgi:hypothetical protein